MHLFLLPEKLQVPDRSKWSERMIYDYLNVKGKCFLDALISVNSQAALPSSSGCCSTHTCQKQGHMCMRRISANLTPAKDAETVAARAIEKMAQDEKVGPSKKGVEYEHFQVWSCDEFVSAVQFAFSELRVIPQFLGCCIECGKAKDVFSLAHGDSSNMFDEVEESEAVESFDDFNLRTDRQRKPEKMTIRKGKRGRAWFGGTFAGNNREVVLKRTEVRQFLVFSGKIAYSRIGRHVFRRRRGVVMGGGLSPCKSGLVYRKQERAFLLSRKRRRLWGMQRLCETGHWLTDYVRTVRIADDDVTISTLHCCECTGKKPSRVYIPPLRHNCESSGTRVGVIDVAIEVRGFSWSIVRLNKNADLALGGLAYQPRVRYLPPLPPPLVSRKNLSRWMSGALALDYSRNPAQPHCCAMGLLMCAEFLQLGYTFAQVARALRAVKTPKTSATARFLAEITRVFARESESRVVHPPEVFWRFLPYFLSQISCSVLLPGILSE